MASRLRPVNADDRVLREHHVRLRTARGRAIPLYGGLVLVSSQSRSAEWHVVATGQKPYCTCESFQVRHSCSHYEAALTLAGSEDGTMKDNETIFRELEGELDRSLVHYRPDNKKPYLEGFEAINQANKIFGFDGWGYEIVEMEYRELTRGSGAAAGMYLARIKVTVTGWQPREDVGVGLTAGTSPEAHETAVKAAVTDGIKRALRGFGPQFGNDLYDKDGEYSQPQRETSGNQNAQQSPRQTAPPQNGQRPAPASEQPKSDNPLCPIHNAPTRTNMSGNGLGHDLGGGAQRGWCDLAQACAASLSELMATYSVTLADLDKVLTVAPKIEKAWADLITTQRARVLPKLWEWAAKKKAADVGAASEPAGVA